MENKFNGPEVVVLRRIQRAGHFGLTSYPRSVHTIGCEMSSKGGHFKTGLTVEDEKYYEAKLSLKPGELDKHSPWWDKIFNVTYPIRLDNNKKTEIILDNPINQIKYKVLIASSKVANSEIEKTPITVFYIDNAEAKAEAELESFNYEFEAMGMVHKFTPDDKRDALRVLGILGVDNSSETMMNAKLVQKLKEDPKVFVITLTDKNLKTKALVRELVEKNILKRKGNYYIHGEDTIAHSSEECVDYLNDKKNQSVRLILESRLNKDKKAVTK